MKTCNLDHGSKRFQPYGKMLQNKNDKCMRIFDNLDAHPHYCNNDYGHGQEDVDAQGMYFEFDGEQIKTPKTGNDKCLQCGISASDAYSKVYMADCNDDGNQQWCAPAPVPASLGSPPTHPQRHLTTPHR